MTLAWSCCLPVARVHFGHAAELLGPSVIGFPVGEAPFSVSTGDFDADGALDLAVPNFDGGSVSILLGDGVGGFDHASEIPIDGAPSFAAVADFDADGVEDLAVAGFGRESVRFLTGNGAGGFEPSLEIEVGRDPLWLASGDFDGSGSVDLAVANFGSASVSILLGDGNGGFARAPDVVVGDGPTYVAAGDFNADSAADLAVANFAGGSVSILLGDGAGGFTGMPDIDLTDGTVGIAVGDLDGDGDSDLAVANVGNSQGDSGCVDILLGDGLGNFGPAPPICVADGPISVDVGDFDLDGAPDLAVAASRNDLVHVLRGDGFGGFAQTQVIPVGGGPSDITVAELDSDGATDLLIANFLTDVVNVLPGDGLGGFVGARETGVDGPTRLAVGDFNRDDNVDLVVSSASGLWLLSGDGSGGLAASVGPAVGGVVSLATGDFDGDGAVDLVAVERDFDAVRVLLADGAGGFLAPTTIVAGADPASVAVGDFDTDGAADLAVAHRGGDSVSIFLGDGLGNFARSTEVGAGDGPVSIVVGNFDIDAAPDLAVANRDGDTVSILVGDGTGGFRRAVEIPVGDGPGSIAAGDFDGDGARDLAVVNEGDGSLTVLASNGVGGFVPFQLVTTPGVTPVSVATADFNLDGAEDLAVADRERDAVAILLSEGPGRFGVAPEFIVGDGPMHVAVADLDADGTSDLVIANNLGDSVTTLLNQLLDRADVNGSNRIDGFDAGALGLLGGATSEDPLYRRASDVDLSGVIDGDDLALTASRFGELRQRASPFRPVVDELPPPPPDAVVLRPIASAGDLLTLRAGVRDTGRAAAAASFAVTLDVPAGSRRVLELVGFAPGSYISGGVTTLYDLDTSDPGKVEIGISRLPPTDAPVSGEQSLLDLIFRARSAGTVVLRLAASGDLPSGPSVLDETGNDVGVRFDDSAVPVTVDTTNTGATGQKVGHSPGSIEFGAVDVGSRSRRVLRISNFGFSELRVVDVSSTLPAIESFFESSFTVPPFGFVGVTVEFTPATIGVFSGELIVESNDPQAPDTDGDGFGELRVPVSGASWRDAAVTPRRLDFAPTLVGTDRIRRIRLTNRGAAPIVLTSIQSSDSRFAPTAGFAILGPGSTGSIDVRFRPDAAGELRGALTLGFDAPARKEVVVRLTGTGAGNP